MNDRIQPKVKRKAFSSSSSSETSPTRPQSLKKRISKNVLNALGRQLQESSLNLLEEEEIQNASKVKVMDVLKEEISDDDEVLRTHHSRTESVDSDTLLETQRTNSTSVYINDRVIHATGVQGSYVLRMSTSAPPPKRKQSAFSSFFSRLRKNTPTPTEEAPSSPPTLNSAKSVSGGLIGAATGGGRVRSLNRNSKNSKSFILRDEMDSDSIDSHDSTHSLLHAPSDARAPFAFWREKCTKSRNQPENHTLRKILTTVTHVINRVVHSVHTAPYIPPAAEKGSVYAPFELVGPEEFSLLIAACTSILGENDRALVRVEAPSKIFGDIHGQIFDLVQFFRQYVLFEDGFRERIIFLNDWITHLNTHTSLSEALEHTNARTQVRKSESSRG